MLGSIKKISQLPLLLTEGLLTIIFACLAGAAYTWNRTSIFYAGEVYFVDGDCFARMARVRLTEEAIFQPLRQHGFENFPFGTIPHTTAPLDYLIIFLHSMLIPITENALAVAGAFISPLLGVATVVFLSVWSQATRVPLRWPMLILFAFSPITAHAFLMGRPDHQSLILALVTVALAAEISLWKNDRRSWAYVSAAAWGLALWVSLFEPLVVLGLVLTARALRWQFGPPIPHWRRIGPLAVFFGILALSLIWEGWRSPGFDPAFARWALTIGELRHGSLGTLLNWGGLMAIAAPALLLFIFWKHRQREALLWCGAILIFAALTFWHVRWGYFFALILALSLPMALTAFRSKAFAMMLFVVALWPIAAAWEETLYPENDVFRARIEQLADAVALRDISLQMTDPAGGGVLAPWWFSPAVVWWSGLPCIGGSSHQSLPGIVDSAKFYLATDDADALNILRSRDVTYVIAYEPSRLEENSAQVLGTPIPPNALIRRISPPSKDKPTFLDPIYANRFFQLLRVDRVSADFQ